MEFDGITVDCQKREVRTKRINTGIIIIPELANILAKTKMGEPIISDQFFHLVILMSDISDCLVEGLERVLQLEKID